MSRLGSKGFRVYLVGFSSEIGCGEPGSQTAHRQLSAAGREGRAGREGSFRMLVGLKVLGALNPPPSPSSE